MDEKSATPTVDSNSPAEASQQTLRRRFGRRVRKHSQGFLIVFLMLSTVVVISALVLRSEVAPAPSAVAFDEGIELQFGLSREAISRSLRIDLCDPKSGVGEGFPECQPNEGGNEPQETRPDIVSTTLGSDPQGDESQFPAVQIGASAANVATTAIVVNVNANPTTPDEVQAGTYEGTIVIDRTTGPAVEIPLSIQLQSRGGQTSLKVLAALIVGALLGTLVKWMNEAFTPLAALRRRQRRIDSFLAGHDTALPEGVVRRLREIREEIKRLQQEGVSDALDLIGRNQDALLAFVVAVEGLERQVARQRAVYMDREMDVSAVRLIQIEDDFIHSLRRLVWPWQVKPEDLQAKLDTAVSQFRRITYAMWSSLDGGPGPKVDLRRILQYVVAHPDEAFTQDIELPPALAPEASTTEGYDLSPASIAIAMDLDLSTTQTPAASQAERRSVSLWLLDNAWWLTLFVIAALVVFAGFQSQFTDSPSFAGTAGDYVALIAWSLAVQVAGGTIIETIGKLRTTSTVAA